MKYPILANELILLLQEDQKAWREFAKREFEANDSSSLKNEKAKLKLRVHQRARRALQILAEVKDPTLSNLGADAAQAMSVLALHDSLTSLLEVLAKFETCYRQYRDDTYFQAIPSMTDWSLVLQRKAQRFGTIWLFDENKTPFLPMVEDFEKVNDRRQKYDIEPLHWPKSLAISEDKQPWLKRPLSESTMREPTDKEYKEFSKDYLAK